jgi:hypothetical protein
MAITCLILDIVCHALGCVYYTVALVLLIRKHQKDRNA